MPGRTSQGQSANKTGGILAGLQVIELSAFVAVPLGGMTLAQMGADVIRVDPLEGGIDYKRWPLSTGGSSLYWAGLNKGKRSVALDVRTQSGQDLIRRLVAGSGPDGGILITNLSPRWLSFEDLRQVRPDLIMVVLAGSPDGAIAVDYTVNAAAGYPEVTGPADSVVNHVLPAWDVAAGNLVATAVLAAERWRSRTGEGCLVEFSLADVAFATVGHLGHIAEVAVNDQDRDSYGNFLYGSFGKDFATRDERRVMVAALTPRQWDSLIAATDTRSEIGLLEAELGSDLSDEGARFAARYAIAGILQPWFEQHSYDDVAATLSQHRACWGPYQSFRQLAEDDPRTRPADNPMWSVVDQPGIGPYPMPGSPLAFSAVPRVAPGPAPRLGEDTKVVLEHIAGLSEDEIETLRNEGVI